MPVKNVFKAFFATKTFAGSFGVLLSVTMCMQQSTYCNLHGGVGTLQIFFTKALKPKTFIFVRCLSGNTVHHLIKHMTHYFVK